MEVEFRFEGDEESTKLVGTNATIFRILNALVRANHLVEVKERGNWRPLHSLRKSA